MNTIILLLATFSASLMAGLFYTWTISIIPGLSRVSDVAYLQTFQSINRAILNPVFFVFFFGLAILLPILTYLYYQSPIKTQFWLILIATLFYLIGVMAVTIVGNIPLNNTLEVLKIDTMNAEQMASFRDGFENKWNQLNLVRTICSSCTLIALMVACLQQSNKYLNN